MTSKTPSRQVEHKQGVKGAVMKRAVQVAILLLFQAAILFLASGRLDWVMAWVYIGMYLVAISINAPIMLRHNPETIAERAEVGENWKDWDKIIGGLFALSYFVFMLLVAGLDVRFGWTGDIALAIQITGTAVFALGYALFSWAMISNAFFASVVRIQDDRGQTVCTTGPYQFVRHPGYLGAVLQSIAVPLMLGSFWSLIPGGFGAVLLILRTALEDRTLLEELDGYEEYTQRVRYRLLLGVW
ncbi:MAG: isoprenylcysteine carboxylmethyltransferase family protein [Anaerolineales bacterium]|nr:isoprenylcysteine carboxylmethyltransferase family protein [Anaerolineales bacterium]